MLTERPPRVGFLYNHDDLHQVAHTAPIIAAFQRRTPPADVQIEILVSSVAQERAVASLLDPTLAAPRSHRLRRRGVADTLERWTGRAAPLGRIATLHANLELLRTFDALVVPETTSTLLKTRFGLDTTKLIYVPHGAGDRAVGFGREVRHFDYVLPSGTKVRDRMLEGGLIRLGGHAVVGYPKFDAVSQAPTRRLFENDRPVVLYNPHADPRLSSWYRFGERVLDFFARCDRYNLVFAPHVMLFRRRVHASPAQRRIRVRWGLPERFRSVPNIHIDLGSTRSIDMTYTRTADVYLGDVSSQIYEFIRRPRPALFLDSHGADWGADPNYAHWKLGRVLLDPNELAEALESPPALTDEMRDAQIAAFRSTFSLDPLRSSSDRAADAIVRFLTEHSAEREEDAS